MFDFSAEQLARLDAEPVTETAPLPKPYLRKGDQLTCTGGHHIATANRDIWRGELISTADFDWIGPVPARHSNVEPCALCGGRYIAGNPVDGHFARTQAGWQLHPGIPITAEQLERECAPTASAATPSTPDAPAAAERA